LRRTPCGCGDCADAFGLAEIYFTRRIPITGGILGVLAFCIVFGGVIAYALWNDALRHWRTSQVMLFNNLIPLSTMAWAWFFLHEPVTPRSGSPWF